MSFPILLLISSDDNSLRFFLFDDGPKFLYKSSISCNKWSFSEYTSSVPDLKLYEYNVPTHFDVIFTMLKKLLWQVVVLTLSCRFYLFASKLLIFVANAPSKILL
jgi:hypothetical protein